MSLPLSANGDSWSCPDEEWDPCEGQRDLACEFTSWLLDGQGIGLRRPVEPASHPRRVTLAFLWKGGCFRGKGSLGGWVVLSELQEVVPSGATGLIRRDALLAEEDACVTLAFLWKWGCVRGKGSLGGWVLLSELQEVVPSGATGLIRRDALLAEEDECVTLAFLWKWGCVRGKGSLGGWVLLSELLDGVPSGASGWIPKEAVVAEEEECWTAGRFLAAVSFKGDFLLRPWWVESAPFLSDEVPDGALRPLARAEAVVAAFVPFWFAPDVVFGADLFKFAWGPLPLAVPFIAPPLPGWSHGLTALVRSVVCLWYAWAYEANSTPKSRSCSCWSRLGGIWIWQGNVHFGRS